MVDHKKATLITLIRLHGMNASFKALPQNATVKISLT